MHGLPRGKQSSIGWPFISSFAPFDFPHQSFLYTVDLYDIYGENKLKLKLKLSWIRPCLSLVPIMLGLIKGNVTKYIMTSVNLWLFLECASRLEHVNKYSWHVFIASMTYFTNASYLMGGNEGNILQLCSRAPNPNDSTLAPGCAPPG